MNEIVKINALELASELAHMELLDSWRDSINVYEDNDETRYTDEAQDVFNDLYDKYLSLIDSMAIV